MTAGTRSSPRAPSSAIYPSDKVGCVRRFTLQDGAELREQLLALSDLEMTFSYCLLDTPIPLFNYVAHVRLLPVTDGNRTFWHWECRFTTPAGREAELADMVGERDLFEAASRRSASCPNSQSEETPCRVNVRIVHDGRKPRHPGLRPRRAASRRRHAADARHQRGRHDDWHACCAPPIRRCRQINTGGARIELGAGVTMAMSSPTATWPFCIRWRASSAAPRCGPWRRSAAICSRRALWRFRRRAAGARRHR